MKLISLQSIVLLLSATKAAARDAGGYLRQDTRGPTLIDKQHLIDGDTEIQVDEESSSQFLKAFKNLQLPSWLTKHAVNLGNNGAVLVEKEQDIIDGEYPWDKQSSSFAFVDQGPRTLLSPWCPSTTPEMWHPDYSNAWSNGGCSLKADCDSPGYSTQLECCKAAYGGQASEACVKRLPNPPTFSPTTVSTKWYADQGTAWSNGGCKNTTPLPIYATIFFDTQLACCKGSFGGQTSGACIKGLPNPPTLSPTTVESAAGMWYAEQGIAWSTGGCKNTTPYPIYATVFFDSQLLCCKGSFGGQLSGACIKGLPNPPTKSPILKPSPKPSLESGLIVNPTTNPSTSKPTTSTSTASPTATASPTQSPTESPTVSPTASSTQSPTKSPTASPTASPTQSPTKSPTANPTASSSLSPTESPTANPTASSTQSPTESPTASPTASSTQSPTESPTASPTQYCFPNKEILQIAVKNYISQNCATNSTCPTRTQYGEIGTWCVKLVTDMSLMFYDKSTFNSDISNWNVSSVTTMGGMFYGASSFNSDISNWNVSSVTTMGGMFYGASSFNSDILNWNVSSVTYMYGMFYGASSFNSDISSWNVSSVTNMNDMFADAFSFNSDISNWNVSSVTDLAYMFYGASSFNSDISSWDVSSVTNMNNMFAYATSFNSDISNWDVSSVTYMYGMFFGASSFNQTLCLWGPKLPSNFHYTTYDNNMFDNSGCPNKNSPTLPTGPWCAVTTCP